MRRLEDALRDLAEQDQRLSTDELITRIEQGLSGRVDSSVVALPERPTMDTIEPIIKTKPSRWNPVSVAAGVAALLLLVVGLPLLMFRGGESVVVDEPATTQAPATTTLPSAPLLPSLNLGVNSWQRVGGDAMDPVVGLFDMTQFGTGLVTVGFDPGFDGRLNGVVFGSDDGLAWQRLAESDRALSQGAVMLYGITEGGPGLVAVGMGCEDDTDVCSPYATVWTSIDGTSWTRSASDPAVFGDTSTQTSAMADVTTTPDGVIAVGTMQDWVLDDAGEILSVAVSPVIWTSPDGITWARAWEGADLALDMETYMDVNVDVSALTVGYSGRLVAVGSSLDQGGGQVAAAWTSDDGTNWDRVPHDPDVFGGDAPMMWDVTANESGFVAVGGRGDPASPVAWVSPDGVTWTRADVDAAAIAYGGSFSAIARLGTGFIAAGPQGFVDQGVGPVSMWTSQDGLVWDPVMTTGPGYVSAIVADESGMAVAGAIPFDDGYHASVWAGPSFDPASPPAAPEMVTFAVPVSDDPAGEVEEGTGIGALAEVVSCDEIAELGFSYPEAVSHWLRYELTEGYGLDIDGPPCSEAYEVSAIEEVFGDPEALSVNIVENHPTGTFEATGPAVDAGLVCATGTIDYTPDPASTEPVLWRWEDELTCDDGSGMFLIGVDEYIDAEGAMYGVWNIVSGTGAYDMLRGGGATDSVFDAFDASIGRLWYASNED